MATLSPHFCENGRYQRSEKEGGPSAFPCRNNVANVYERGGLVDDAVAIQLGAGELYKFTVGLGVRAGLSVQIQMLHFARAAAECYLGCEAGVDDSTADDSGFREL